MDISLDKRFLVKCRDCGVILLDDVSSAEGAEEVARSHINDANYAHVVEISEYTVVGRGV